MTAENSNGRSSVQIEQVISRRIAELTGSQIRSMTVRIVGNHIQVRGSASCYYHKQLALQGVFDALGAELSSQSIIELEIEVVAQTHR